MKQGNGMMHCRTRRLAMFGAVIMAMAAAGATAWADEIAVAMTNAGMEEGVGGKPAHWQLWTTSEPDVSFALDPEVRHGGRVALRIRADKATLYSVAGQRLSGLRPGELYALTGWIKAREAMTRTDYTGACLVTTCKDGDDKILDTRYSRMRCGIADWQRVTHYSMAIEGTEIVDVSCVKKQCAGTAWFDDLRLEHCPLPLEPPAPPDVDGKPALVASEQANPMLLDGFGVEWDPRFWRACNREARP